MLGRSQLVSVNAGAGNNSTTMSANKAISILGGIAQATIPAQDQSNQKQSKVNFVNMGNNIVSGTSLPKAEIQSADVKQRNLQLNYNTDSKNKQNNYMNGPEGKVHSSDSKAIIAETKEKHIKQLSRAIVNLKSENKPGTGFNTFYHVNNKEQDSLSSVDLSHTSNA